MVTADSEIQAFPEGTTVRQLRLASGLTMRCYERGPTESNTAIFLHGFPELAVSWRAQVAALGENWRLVVPDMRGYGGTDAPSRICDYDLDLLVQDVYELQERVEAERVHLVGHDWGGGIAWAYAMAHASRLRSLTVLNCPPGGLMLRHLVRPRQLLKSWYMFWFMVPGLAERRVTRDPERIVPAIFRGTAYNKAVFGDEVLEPYLRQFRERGLPAINYYRAAARRPRFGLDRIDVPTRLLWGRHDQMLGVELGDPRRYRSFVPDFERVMIEDAGHWVQQEAATTVNRLLREHWLRCEA